MNQRTIRVAIWCVISGGLGWLAGKTIASKIVLKEEEDDGQWEKLADEETEEWADKNGPKLIILDKETVKKTKKNTPRVNYEKFSKSSLDELVASYSDEDSHPEPLIKDDNYPHIITINEFGENQECESLKYYEEDDTLADEKNEVIADPEKIVGGEALLNFGKGSEDVDIVYVRNNLLKIDYEIERVHSSFSYEVLGVKPEPAKKPVKRRTSRAKAKSSDDDESEE